MQSKGESSSHSLLQGADPPPKRGQQTKTDAHVHHEIRARRAPPGRNSIPPQTGDDPRTRGPYLELLRGQACGAEARTEELAEGREPIDAKQRGSHGVNRPVGSALHVGGVPRDGAARGQAEVHDGPVSQALLLRLETPDEPEE